MPEINKASADTLATRFNKLRTGIDFSLLELLGKDLYNVVKSGEVEKEMPFGVKTKYDFRDKRLTFKKELGSEWDVLFEMMKDDYRVKLKKEF
tara:strand:+ start:129 stop:407 length:279 start_codon:yes stop_codon:yes gene_type:complete